MRRALPICRSSGPAWPGPFSKVKAVSATRVARGGETGWWRWLVPVLVVSVVLLAAVDVRKVSDRARHALDSATRAQDLASTAEQTKALEFAAWIARGRDATVVKALARNRRQIASNVAALSRHNPDDEQLFGLPDTVKRANRALDRMLRQLEKRDLRGAGRVHRRDAAPTWRRLSDLANSLSNRYTSDSSELDARARRRSTLTLAIGILLAGLLMWSFWAKRSGAQAEQRERRFRTLLQNSSDLVVVVDAQGSIRYSTPVVQGMLGYDAEAIAGTNLLDMVASDDRPQVASALRGSADEPGNSVTSQWRARHSEDVLVNVESVCLNLTDDPSVGGLVLTIRDVGERKTLQERLHHQAFHDALTGLPNRALFEDRVCHAVAHARRDGDSVAVLFVDLDDFKTVNDSLGHAAGDELLRQVAKRVDEGTRASDTAARIGGDEFAVLVERPADHGQAAMVAERVHAALHKPFELPGNEIFVHASIGIATSAHELAGEELLRNADIAMYAAKAAGKSRTEAFRPTMYLAAQKRLQLSGDLRRAVRDGDFTVQYQPLVELEDGRILGVEALVRWQHPTLGQIPPNDFIPLAEETGLIIPIGQLVLREACRQAKQWQTQNPGRDPMYVSVNLSARQFRPAGQVVEHVRAATTEADLDPSCLMLEITESVLVKDRESVVQELRRLQQLGCRIALDDFGTGYSALSYLRQFPINTVKMDRSFVRDLARGAGDAALVRSVVELGEALDMDIVAEGIEQRDQLDSLSTLRCNVGQGYYFAPPLDPDAVAEILANEPRAMRGTRVAALNDQ